MNIQNDKDLFLFLANSPKEFCEGEKIKKFQLKNGDFIHCVFWNMHFYITGTDIVKILVWRFQNAGRQLVSLKKFEEGVFSDLRNLKPGIDATLEGPRSEFLEFLYKNGCIRTQKKQKVFFWYSVPHDALFCDALERDLRRETNLYTYSKYMNTVGKANPNFKELQKRVFEARKRHNEEKRKSGYAMEKMIDSIDTPNTTYTPNTQYNPLQPGFFPQNFNNPLNQVNHQNNPVLSLNYSFSGIEDGYSDMFGISTLPGSNNEFAQNPFKYPQYNPASSLIPETLQYTENMPQRQREAMDREIFPTRFPDHPTLHGIDPPMNDTLMARTTVGQQKTPFISFYDRNDKKETIETHPIETENNDDEIIHPTISSSQIRDKKNEKS